MSTIKQILKPYYHAVRTRVNALVLRCREKMLALFVPDTYRKEFIFFETIKAQIYTDNSYLTKRIRMTAHFVEKDLTLSKKHNATSAVEQTKKLLDIVRPQTEWDNITCTWANEILTCYSELPTPFRNNSQPIPTGAPELIASIIKDRRSIRSYTQEPVSEDVLNKILEAGLWAPSGCNRQPVEYLVVNHPEDVSFCQKYAGEPSCFPKEAAVNVVILVDARGYALPHQRHMAYLDGGAAIQNMLLTAHAQGLGTCWMFWARHDKAFNEKFGLEPWLLPVSLICIGHINLHPPIVPGRKPVCDAIHDIRRS